MQLHWVVIHIRHKPRSYKLLPKLTRDITEQLADLAVYLPIIPIMVCYGLTTGSTQCLMVLILKQSSSLLVIPLPLQVLKTYIMWKCGLPPAPLTTQATTLGPVTSVRSASVACFMTNAEGQYVFRTQHDLVSRNTRFASNTTQLSITTSNISSPTRGFVLGHLELGRHVRHRTRAPGGM